MNAETKTCQNCKTKFTIEPVDFDFYKKISVPPPTFCPDCRLQRRLSWRNERSLYHRQCELCSKVIIAMYSPDKPFSVYCPECWWSDKWDPLRYGRDYNFAKPFFEQFKELVLRVPRMSLGHKDFVDAPYTNYIIHVKNSYLVFGGHDVEDSAYVSLRSHFLKNCVDVSQSHHSELCYECMDVSKCYAVSFGRYCEGCNTSMFLYDCRNCSDCVGCVGLRGKQYHIFNRSYSKENYQKELEKLNLGSCRNLQSMRERFREFTLGLPKKYAMILQSVNVTGDDIMQAKNCRQCFAVSLGMEDCAYLWSVDRTKDSHDINFTYLNELCYEGMSPVESRGSRLSNTSWTNHDITYADNCHDCGDIFGCVGLRNKEYCVLNKQYSKEEYRAITRKIIAHMDEIPYFGKRGRVYKFGEFFPTELSPFAYNETVAMEYFPFTKEEVGTHGYDWKEPEERKYEITMQFDRLPDHIRNAEDSIVQEIVGCEHQGRCNEQCTMAFKIIPQELQFYRRLGLSLPRFCPNCRHYQRVRQKNPLKLWRRRCDCRGATARGKGAEYRNAVVHFHGGSPCLIEFETSYAPERPEIVYCEQCYQAEVV